MKTKSNLKPGTRTILFISAHPDDSEFRGCGFAALARQAGDRVVILSVTDGSSGHMSMDPISLAERRKREAQHSADVIGAESYCLGIRDGYLEPSIMNRMTMISAIRKISPDIIVTNRLNDYHPDHRYTAELVQDASYMLMVPNVCPDVPALRYNPIVLYWGDGFTSPEPFRPDVVVSIDSVIDKKLAMLYAHESQLFEWLPFVDKELDDVPGHDDKEGRMSWIRHMYDKRIIHRFADMYRDMLIARYGEMGMAIRECEAYQVCEYGYVPAKEELDLIFAGM